MSEKEAIFDHSEARRVAELLRESDKTISELTQDLERYKIAIKILCNLCAEMTARKDL